MLDLLIDQPQDVAICEIVERPTEFNGKLLKVSGSFLTDWHHGILVVGQPCGRGIWFNADTETLGDPWRAIENTQGAKEPPKINLTVVGRFAWNPSATGMYPKIAVINVTSIVALDIKPSP